MFSNTELPRTGSIRGSGDENDPLKVFITQYKVAEYNADILSFVSENN